MIDIKNIGKFYAKCGNVFPDINEIYKLLAEFPKNIDEQAKILYNNSIVKYQFYILLLMSSAGGIL